MLLLTTSKNSASPPRLWELTNRPKRSFRLSVQLKTPLKETKIHKTCVDATDQLQLHRTRHKKAFLKLRNKILWRKNCLHRLKLWLSQRHQVWTDQNRPPLFPQARVKNKQLSPLWRSKTKCDWQIYVLKISPRLVNLSRSLQVRANADKRVKAGKTQKKKISRTGWNNCKLRRKNTNKNETECKKSWGKAWAFWIM